MRVEYVHVEPAYLIGVLQLRWLSEYLSLFSVGATMESLNTSILKAVPVLLPPGQEQRQLLDAIARDASGIDRATTRAEQEIALLREYRTRLVADVVTGKLDVREAAAQLPAEADEPESPDIADVSEDGSEDADDGEDADLESVDETAQA